MGDERLPTAMEVETQRGGTERQEGRRQALEWPRLDGRPKRGEKNNVGGFL